jgi:hypothetical protein
LFNKDLNYRFSAFLTKGRHKIFFLQNGISKTWAGHYLTTILNQNVVIIVMQDILSLFFEENNVYCFSCLVTNRIQTNSIKKFIAWKIKICRNFSCLTFCMNFYFLIWINFKCVDVILNSLEYTTFVFLRKRSSFLHNLNIKQPWNENLLSWSKYCSCTLGISGEFPSKLEIFIDICKKK